MAIIREFAAARHRNDGIAFGTDTVALLRGGRPGPTLLLRADIDALPIQDNSAKPWSSTIPGKSHACGHDGHMAMLLGAMKIASEFANDLAGNIRFVFQPAEEEIGGGKALIEKGLLELEPKASVAFAFHGWSGLPTGKISCAPGRRWRLRTVLHRDKRKRRTWGHAPRDDRSVVAAAQSLIALQSMGVAQRRSLKPSSSPLLAPRGEYAQCNTDEEVLGGTISYFDKELGNNSRRKNALRRFEHLRAWAVRTASPSSRLYSTINAGKARKRRDP